MKKLRFLKSCVPFGIACFIGVFLLVTGFDRHRIYPLKPICPELLPHFSLKEERVLVIAKAMTKEESKRNFGHDLIGRGIQPLHLMIQNNTAEEYSLCPSSVDLPSISVSKIAFKITKSAIPRAIGYKIASFFFWPFMIPGTIDSLRVMSHHRALKKDLNAKSVRKEIVAPYATFHRVLFVPKAKLEQRFKVTLIELESLKAHEFETELEKPT